MQLCFHVQQCAEKYLKAIFYSNRARGERARRASANGAKTTAAPSEQPNTELAARAKATWARLIRKVYEADPLEYPKCKEPMRVIALIEEPEIIQRILDAPGAVGA